MLSIVFVQAQKLPFIEFEENGKYGFKDSTGRIVVPLKYDYAHVYCCVYGNNIAIVNIGGKMKANHNFDGGKWGLIDKTGKEITPLRYDRIEDTSEDGARVAIGLKDTSGTLVVSENGNSKSFDFACKIGGKWGFIDTTGKEITPLKYDWIFWCFRDGAAPMGIGGKWTVVPSIAEQFNEFGNSHSVYTTPVPNYVGGKYGFIDKTGKEIVPLIYDDVDNFHNGKAYVKLGERGFYIDKNGNEVKE